MITATLAVFSIAASILMFEDWLEQFRSAAPQDSIQRRYLMAGLVLGGTWLVSIAITWPIHWILGADA
jgi:hypothetical protein